MSYQYKYLGTICILQYLGEYSHHYYYYEGLLAVSGIPGVGELYEVGLRDFELTFSL